MHSNNDMLLLQVVNVSNKVADKLLGLAYHVSGCENTVFFYRNITIRLLYTLCRQKSCEHGHNICFSYLTRKLSDIIVSCFWTGQYYLQ